MTDKLSCVMPWKALFMDEHDGRVAALPCCLSWIKEEYGTVGSASLNELWNSQGAQRIRHLIASGQQDEICDRHCPYRMSGKYGESAVRVVDGPAEFVENQLLNNEEIRERKTVLKSRPMLVKVLPTLKCNLRCTMCFQDHYGHVDLGKDFWNQVDELLPFAHEITFQGGEVTTDRAFRKFLVSPKLHANPHVRISLITNGTILDDELINSLSGVSINYVIISVNAATRSTYHHVAKADVFETVLKNIRRWIELAAEHPLRQFDILLSFVVMRSNFEELPSFVQFTEQLGVKPQLLHVVGDRDGEDIFVRTDQHTRLRGVLKEAKRFARSQVAKDQVERIRLVLEEHSSTVASTTQV